MGAPWQPVMGDPDPHPREVPSVHKGSHSGSVISIITKNNEATSGSSSAPRQRPIRLKESEAPAWKGPSRCPGSRVS